MSCYRTVKGSKRPAAASYNLFAAHTRAGVHLSRMVASMHPSLDKCTVAHAIKWGSTWLAAVMKLCFEAVGCHTVIPPRIMSPLLPARCCIQGYNSHGTYTVYTNTLQLKRGQGNDAERVLCCSAACVSKRMPFFQFHQPHDRHTRPRTIGNASVVIMKIAHLTARCAFCAWFGDNVCKDCAATSVHAVLYIHAVQDKPLYCHTMYFKSSKPCAHAPADTDFCYCNLPVNAFWRASGWHG